jgi:hypothetical protein
MRRAVGIAVLPALTIGVNAAGAAQSSCSHSRECLASAASVHLQARVAHDPAAFAARRNVEYTGNGMRHDPGHGPW